MSCGVYIQSEPSTTQPRMLRLHLFSTYSHGVTSPNPGALYVFLDRRTVHDDNRGLNEPLRGRWIAQSNFRLFVESVFPERRAQQKVSQSVTMIFPSRIVYSKSPNLLYDCLIGLLNPCAPIDQSIWTRWHQFFDCDVHK